MNLETPQVVLRSLRTDDYGFLYYLRTEVSSLHLWENPYHLPSQKEYYQELDSLQRNRFEIFAVIALQGKPEPIGMVYTLSTNLVDGHTFFAGVIAPNARRMTVGTQAATQFISFCFSRLPIRKLYSDVSDFNAGSLALMHKLGFVEEGRFSDHRFFEGGYWTGYRFAFFRHQVTALPLLATAM